MESFCNWREERRGVDGGELRMENGEWRVENGELRIENGKWIVDSRELKVIIKLKLCVILIINLKKQKNDTTKKLDLRDTRSEIV